MAEKKDTEEKRMVIEAALFIAARPMSLAELYEVVKIPKPQIKKILESMTEHYDNHGIRLVVHGDLYELQIKDEYVKHVEHLAPERDFSRATMQTLSLIAYRSPMKQSDVIEIRGNRAYEHIKELVSKGFLRQEPKGHTNILHVTKKFLEYFNISSESELKEYFAREGVAESETGGAKKEEKNLGDFAEKEEPAPNSGAGAEPGDKDTVQEVVSEEQSPAPEKAENAAEDDDSITDAIADETQKKPAHSAGKKSAKVAESENNAPADVEELKKIVLSAHKKKAKPDSEKKKPVDAVENPYKSQFSDVIGSN